MSGARRGGTADGKAELFRKGDGNVIYANFGGRATADLPRKKSTTQQPGTWAARFLRQSAEQLFDAGRLQRGRKYARDEHILKLQFSDGAVSALVQGSQNEPFTTVMTLTPLGIDQRTELLTELASDPAAMHGLTMGVVSDTVGHALLGADAHDLRFHCDCPDPVYPCKHAAALVEALATELDKHPTRLLELRALTPAHVQEHRRALTTARRAQSKSDANAADGDFWGIRGELPELPHPKTASALEDTDIQLLQEAMRTVSYTAIDTLQAVSDLEDCFYFLTREDGI